MGRDDRRDARRGAGNRPGGGGAGLSLGERVFGARVWRRAGGGLVDGGFGDGTCAGGGCGGVSVGAVWVR